MRRSYQKYNRINTDRYKKSIKSSLWSILSISVGLLFTYLAMTNPVNDMDEHQDKKQITQETEAQHHFVQVEAPKLKPPKKEVKQETNIKKDTPKVDTEKITP